MARTLNRIESAAARLAAAELAPLTPQEIQLQQQRADAQMRRPFWPFAELTPLQMRRRARQERVMRGEVQIIRRAAP